jgi:5-methylcytosine-specific restriction endonuclease McrA
MFGRQPTSRELRQQGNISLNVFQRKYGSWIKAIHAFCQDRENTVEERFNKSKNISNNSQFSKTDQFQVKSENATQINKEKLIIMRTPRHPSPRLRFRVLSRDKFACVKCGRSPKADGIKLHVDHCIPYSKGGETIFENLETLCEICNIGKGNIIFES